MCKEFHFFYLACGHTRIEDRLCNQGCRDFEVVEGCKPSIDFCPMCFMLTYPQDSPSYDKGAGSYQYKFPLPGMEFNAAAEEEASQLWDRAKNINYFRTKDDEEDLYMLVDENENKLTALQHCFWIAVMGMMQAGFWSRINGPPKSIPTGEERIFLLQFDTIYLSSWMSHQTNLLEQTDYKRVRIDSLQPTEKSCYICYEEFGVPNDTGSFDMPVRTCCNHVYGKKCFEDWILRQPNCPLCRRAINASQDWNSPLRENMIEEYGREPYDYYSLMVMVQMSVFSDSIQRRQWPYVLLSGVEGRIFT